ncbi:adenosine deaminase [Telmatospirillum sp. J64-1]|uniref:adenosine deaminase n=1 Tax=Telmatospirillum sp. J64-1 TaxID=2502183 RepID=UPI00115DEABC|nr:adenosine deaminase [Telmatospirillum sp. J64-1]
MIDILALPKAELHMHIEGSLEPAMLLELAARNGVAIPFATQAEVEAACEFQNLQTFLDLYYAGLTVMCGREDFTDVTYAYLRKAHEDAVKHAEMFISPQAHLRRGITFPTMMDGILEAMEAARQDFGITSGLILGLQRQFPEAEGFEVLEQARAYEDRVVGLGLGGPELGNPPSKFERVFAAARARGWKTMAHAGEEGGADYVREAVEILKVDRIDHGVRCEDDDDLVHLLAERQIPLTVCPLSNVRLKVFQDMAEHNIARLLRAGLAVTANSDDPPYFGGYVNDNYVACREALDLTDAELVQLAKNSFTASFLPQEEIARHLRSIDAAIAGAAAGE